MFIQVYQKKCSFEHKEIIPTIYDHTTAESQERCHNKLEIQQKFNRKKEKAKILNRWIKGILEPLRVKLKGDKSM